MTVLYNGNWFENVDFIECYIKPCLIFKDLSETPIEPSKLEKVFSDGDRIEATLCDELSCYVISNFWKCEYDGNRFHAYENNHCERGTSDTLIDIHIA